MRPASFGSRAHLHSQRSAKTHVIALHCSGSSGRQWRSLTDLLGSQYSVVAPDLFGCGSRGPWPGERPFTLKEEVAPVVDVIDRLDGPVHLVGHSYSGTVAVCAALARPSRVASLSLYEPMLPHVLKSMGAHAMGAWQELHTLFGEVDQAVRAGWYRRAARRFFEYFNSMVQWTSMKPEGQDALVQYIPKACLESRAIMGERTPLMAYSRLRMPTLLMHGEGTPQPLALITRRLAEVMKPGSWNVLQGADHMAPVTRSAEVAAAIARHIAGAGGSSSNEAPVAKRDSR